MNEITYQVENNNGETATETVTASQISKSSVVIFTETLNALDELLDRRYIRKYSISWIENSVSGKRIISENKRSITTH